jgi:putative Ca2+/H+ antiporter (TMEM165/GDT1 family)
MEAFLVSVTSIATAEMGDRTQLLALVLAARYRKPWPIVAGVVCATLASHGIAGLLGSLLGGQLRPALLDAAVGVSMIAMALWTLKPDKLDREDVSSSSAGAFVATVIAFFLAEIGDKTQIATIALAAAYPNLLAVISGTSCGMLIANVPVIFLGNAFAHRLPLKAIHYAASALFGVVGVIFVVRALRQWS